MCNLVKIQCGVSEKFAETLIFWRKRSFYDEKWSVMAKIKSLVEIEKCHFFDIIFCYFVEKIGGIKPFDRNLLALLNGRNDNLRWIWPKSRFTPNREHRTQDSPDSKEKVQSAGAPSPKNSSSIPPWSTPYNITTSNVLLTQKYP